MSVKEVVILPFNDNVLGKTTTNMINKYAHTIITRIWGRMSVELLDNIFIRDILQNSLLECLRL